MRLSRLLSHDRIVLSAALETADGVLSRLAELLADPHHPQALLHRELLRREQGASTGLGDGVAIPHTRVENLDKPRAAFLVTRRGVDFQAPDGEPVDLYFALLVPTAATGEHLAILAEIAECFGDAGTRAILRQARSPETVIEVLRDSLTGAAA